METRSRGSQERKPGILSSTAQPVLSPVSIFQRTEIRKHHRHTVASTLLSTHSREHEYVDTLFLAVDANFKLKRFSSSSVDADPALNNGGAYFVHDGNFKEHIVQYEPLICQPKKSTCNNHDALKQAAQKNSKGLDTSGVGALCCGRHEMKRGSSVVKLKKGEKYVYLHSLVQVNLIGMQIRLHGLRSLIYNETQYSKANDVILRYRLPVEHQLVGSDQDVW